MPNQVPASPDAGQAADVRYRLILERRFQTGINWFYWIGGLAVISTIIYLGGYALAFVVGLGATHLIDLSVIHAGTWLRLAGIAGSLAISALFILFGYLGRRKLRWLIIAGMILYALDALLLVDLQDWLGVAFHVWGLVSIWSGLKALGQLQALESPAA